jgi:hypothetical protein
VAVLAEGASYDEFCEYTTRVRGPLSNVELQELWSWRQKLLGVRFDTGRGYRSQLPQDEQHLTSREREAKVFAEAKSQGRNIEKLPERNPHWI